MTDTSTSTARIRAAALSFLNLRFRDNEIEILKETNILKHLFEFGLPKGDFSPPWDIILFEWLNAPIFFFCFFSCTEDSSPDVSSDGLLIGSLSDLSWGSFRLVAYQLINFSDSKYVHMDNEIYLLFLPHLDETVELLMRVKHPKDVYVAFDLFYFIHNLWLQILRSFFLIFFFFQPSQRKKDKFGHKVAPVFPLGFTKHLIFEVFLAKAKSNVSKKNFFFKKNQTDQEPHRDNFYFYFYFFPFLNTWNSRIISLFLVSPSERLKLLCLRLLRRILLNVDPQEITVTSNSKQLFVDSIVQLIGSFYSSSATIFQWLKSHLNVQLQIDQGAIVSESVCNC